MNSRLLTLLAPLAIVLALGAGSAHAVVVAADEASNYTSWTNGTNGGTGFGGWSLSGGGSHGFFLGNSTNIGGPGADINSANGTSLGMFGQGFADAVRTFGAPLAVGETFSLDIAVNFRNGNKGLDLRDGGGAKIFNFNVGGDNYVVNDAATGNGSIGNVYNANTEFRLSFTQLSAVGGAWTIVRSGGVADLDAGTYTGLAAGFKLYVNGTDFGSSANDFMANGMTITAVPEASAFLFGGVALVGTSLWRLRGRFR